MKFPSFLTAALLSIVSLSAASARDSGCKVLTDSIYSDALKCHRSYNVYLPKGYESRTYTEYPVLYLLHGLWGDNTDWTQRGHVRDVMDHLVSSGEIDEMVIIMPMAGIGKNDPKACHGYFNQKDWPYEDFFFNEFMPEIEKRYRIISDKAHRAIAGLSMGGGGTTAYAQQHSDLFCAAYAMSALMNEPGDRAKLPSDDEKINAMRRSAQENSCLEFVVNATEEDKEKLRSVKWFVDCGDDDYLLEVNLDFAKAMREARIPFEFRVREGAHNWEYWHSALYICLPFFDRCFGN